MKNHQQRYLEINGEQVAVTEEIYLAYMRFEWKEQKRIEREGRCRDENGNRCMEDCRRCREYRDGRPVSLDKLDEDGFVITDPIDAQKYIEDKLLFEAIYDAIDALESKNRHIISLFYAGLTEREIAAQVGLSQKGVNKRKNRIFEQLREKLENFR